MKLFSLLILLAALIGASPGARGTYNYGDVVGKSLLFYEAQRCGRLPSTNRIRWRRSSFMNDRDGRFDLNGGYFDAGDYVKFNFPMAYSMTTLAMGGIEFPKGYSQSGQTNNLYHALKWGLDYLLKVNFKGYLGGAPCSIVHRATGDKSYLTDAETFYAQGNFQWQTGFNWDQKVSGVDVLLARATGKQQYKDKLKNFCSHAITEASKEPKGLLLDTDWGSLRSTSNTVFICLNAAKLNIDQNNNRNFARKQIDLMLGEFGRSFVVGMGKNPPVNPHHRASSCPNPQQPCGWNFFHSPARNTNSLVGALVGGPKKDGTYEDRRDDAVRNEIALDYNAGFQGACAGLEEVFGQKKNKSG